jgi:hypothetical protein
MILELENHEVKKLMRGLYMYSAAMEALAIDADGMTEFHTEHVYKQCLALHEKLDRLYKAHNPDQFRDLREPRVSPLLKSPLFDPEKRPLSS